jgi:uncharacterized protein YcfJ
MKVSSKITLGLALGLFAHFASAQITFYGKDGFRGEAFRADKPIRDLRKFGFNDRASSVIVDRGRWEVCEDPGFSGGCVVLVPGSYPSLRDIGLNNQLSSVRPAGGRKAALREAAPPPNVAVYEYRRRPEERIFEAPVTSVHAVVGPPSERCWVERQEVPGPRHDEPNVAGGVLGAVIGGVIGHQIGSGGNRDVATAGGALAGAVIGANAGGSQGGGTQIQSVRRCNTVPNAAPAFWDVGYTFRGVAHQVQLSHPPGPSIAVNESGQPRQ